MASRTVVSGQSSLRSHLRACLPNLRRSPCLLISSSPPPPTPGAPPKKVDQNLKAFMNNIDDFVKKANFVSSMEMGIRTVHGTVSSVYPTWTDVEGCVELARRSGATTVLGVGAGSAIDLAKTVSSILTRHDAVDLVLAPATPGAAMASMSTNALILSQEEEALLPAEYASSGSHNETFPEVAATVTLDGDAMAVPFTIEDASRRQTASILDAVFASLTICVDAAHGLSAEDEHINNLIVNTIDNALAAVSHEARSHDSEEITLAKNYAIAATVHAGQLLSFGSGAGRARRSIPLALASSLLPRYFPHGHILTFFASMMPGLCIALSNDAGASKALEGIALSITGGSTMSDVADWANDVSKEAKLPSMASLAEGAPDVHAMMGRLDANAALLNCEDARFDVVEEVLHRSLNR